LYLNTTAQAPHRLQNDDAMATIEPAEFDILCPRTYDSFDWIILIGSVVILLCVSLCCGWTAHILWTRDEYDPRHSINCREMQMPKMSPPISPSLSDKVRAKFSFAGKQLKDRYNKRSTESVTERSTEVPHAQALAQGRDVRHSHARQGSRCSYAAERPQTPGHTHRLQMAVTINDHDGKEQVLHGHVETQTPMLLEQGLELSMGDETNTTTLTTAHTRMGSLTGTGSGLRLCTVETMASDGKDIDGVRELTIASTEEKWPRAVVPTPAPLIITPPGSEQRDRADRYSTPL